MREAPLDQTHKDRLPSTELLVRMPIRGATLTLILTVARDAWPIWPSTGAALSSEDAIPNPAMAVIKSR